MAFSAKSDIQLAHMSSAEISAELENLPNSGWQPNDPNRMMQFIRLKAAKQKAEKKEFAAEQTQKSEQSTASALHAKNQWRNLENAVRHDPELFAQVRGLKAYHLPQATPATT